MAKSTDTQGQTRTKQAHSPSGSPSELSQVGSVSFLLGNDNDLQTVYHNMTHQTAVCTGEQQITSVGHSDIAKSHTLTAEGDKRQWPVVARKPLTSAAKRTQVMNADSSEEMDSRGNEAHRDQIKILFEEAVKTKVAGHPSRTWSKATLARTFCRAPRLNADALWTQMYPAEMPDVNEARLFTDDIDTMRVMYGETLKSVCHTVRRMN